MVPKLSSLGEFGLIQKIRKMLGPPRGNLKIGIGDDAALFKPAGKDVVVTKDMLVEKVHFDFKFAAPFEVGWRAMAANLSDIAAMGGSPYYALVGIAARPDTSADRIIAIYRGMMKLASKFNCQIAGGDTVSTPGPLTISITVIGSPLGKNAFLRSNARPYDKILITGWPGKAALALKENRLIRTVPRLEEIKYLSRKLRINALIDTSDGISSDLTRVCEESKTGALLFEKNLPIAPLIKRLKRKERLSLILNGGEDFELLLTTPEGEIAPLISQFKKRFNIPLSVIGEIKSQKYGLKILGADGREEPLKSSGYEHFRG